MQTFDYFVEVLRVREVTLGVGQGGKRLDECNQITFVLSPKGVSFSFLRNITLLNLLLSPEHSIECVRDTCVAHTPLDHPSRTLPFAQHCTCGTA